MRKLQDGSHLVFDLDDTLLETTKKLIPQAARRACVSMINAGLPCQLKECLATRDLHMKRGNDGHFLDAIIERFPPETHLKEAIRKAGAEAFYKILPNDCLEPNPQLKKFLRNLKTYHPLHLVTAGDFRVQKKKIEILQISSYFDSILIIQKGQKIDAFLQIQKENASPPENCVSIGDRLDTDLEPASRLGWVTVWVTQGEHQPRQMRFLDFTPDIQINHIYQIEQHLKSR